MNQFQKYSAYYDLLYADKNYAEEVSYIDTIIRKYGKINSDLLDIGCGTGKHANLLADKGYNVCGIDISVPMIEIATKNYGNKISFFSGDLRNFDLNRSFDVITSLFHVMSYQITNDDVNNAIMSVYRHLNKGGCFIFDCWHGPGIMNDPPVVRVKRMANAEFEVIRISEPLCDYNNSVIEVQITTIVKDLKTNDVKKVFESHKMRFFFRNEIDLFARVNGFTVEGFYSWLTFDEPKGKEWYSVFVLKK